jgi:hypothetical protein
MKHAFKLTVAGILAGLMLPTAVVAQPAPAATNSEDTRLTAFLDAEFADWLKRQPQTATRLVVTAGTTSPTPPPPNPWPGARTALPA